MIDEKLERGDEVVFKQTFVGDNPKDSLYQIYVDEDSVAYTVHHGLVQKDLGDTVKVKWDDGEHTETQKHKLSRPEDVNWYPL